MGCIVDDEQRRIRPQPPYFYHGLLDLCLPARVGRRDPLGAILTSTDGAGGRRWPILTDGGCGN